MSETSSKSLLAKILFVIGVIIILVLLAFAIIRFAPMIFSGLANVSSSFGKSIGKSSTQALSVSTSNNDLVDGDKFNISWNYNAPGSGNYAISYACTNNAIFEIVTNNETKRLICNTPYSLGDNVNSVGLQANYSQENSFADIPFTVSFTKSGSNVPEDTGEALVTIKNSNANLATVGGDGALSSTTITGESTGGPATVTSGTGGTGAKSVATTPATVKYTNVSTGRPDLAISNVVSVPNQSTVYFTVSNIGGRSTGTWNFNYTTPNSRSGVSTSPLQLSLAPGEGIRFTLRFLEQDSGNGTISIFVDPSNLISELNEGNNSTSVGVTGNTNRYDDNDNDQYDEDGPDFEIRNLEVGRILNGRFIRDEDLQDRDEAVVRFTVRNIGDQSTRNWRFVVLDTPYDENNNSFRSQIYDSLRPGESEEITVEFDNIDQGNYNIRVNIDSDDDTREDNERNNSSRVDLDVN